MEYIPVIGLEIHVELNTKTKMFCSCSADYWGKKPNTHTCPVCLGLPGALPYTNKIALEKCMMLGLALNCNIAQISRFERKNYFYPDLPKGYQISQYRWPLCINGFLELSNGKRIRINRVHQEEDTAKLVHQFGIQKSKIPLRRAEVGKNQNLETGIDFNRSGVPLVEIVTEPDFEDSNQAVEFAKSLRQILLDLNVSNADMERGDLRLEANVSVRNNKQKENLELPDYRVELKNINSFRFMQHALEYEIARQIEIKEEGGKLTLETRGWDEEKKISYLQRGKEEAHDYRYFPEPDIPEIVFSDKDIDKVKGSIPSLTGEMVVGLSEKYGITPNLAKVLLAQGTIGYFEEIIKIGGDLDAVAVANVIVNKRIDTNYQTEDFIKKFREKSVQAALSEQGLEIAVVSVIKNNQKAAGDFKKGKESAIQFLLGQVMRETKGQANANQARELLITKLKND